MPGSRPTEPVERPAIRSQITTHTFLGTIPQRVILIGARPVDYKINQVSFRQEALDGTTTAITAVIAKTVDGVALSTNTDITGTLGAGSVSGVGQANKTRDFAFLTSFGVPTENIVKGSRFANGVETKGEVLILEFSAAPAASITQAVVTVVLSEILE